MFNTNTSFLFPLLRYIFVIFLHCLLATPAMAEELQRFDIWEYQVTGNSLLEAATIQSGLSVYLGVNKTLKTVEQARDYLQTMYKKRGYLVTANIPQQNVIGGMVTLNVIEGRIDRLKVSGNKYFSRRELRKEVPSLKAGKPLNMDQVRYEIDIANQSNTFRSIVPVIRPGRHRGTMEVELKVKDRLPLQSFIEVNNRYTANTTQTRLMAGVSYDHLWQKHHSISLNYQMSPEDLDEVSVLNMTYAMPTGETSRLVLYAVKSDSEVATVTGQGDDLTVLGNGSVYGVRSIIPLQTVQLYYHSIIFGMDYKDFGETQNISNEDDETGLSVPIKYAAWSLSYNGTIRSKVLTRYTVTGNFGLRGINDPEDFDFKRYRAKANYFYLGANFGQGYTLADNVNVNYDIRGQFTQSPLISNEQFSAGGMDTVRGYLESSALGDNALLGSVELSYKPFTKAPSSNIQNMSLNVFIDAVRLRTLDALPDASGQTNSITQLMGAGVGVTMQAFKNSSLRFYYAQPLKNLKSVNFKDEGKLHFSLVYNF